MLFSNYSRILFASSIAVLSVGTLVGYTPQAKAIDIIFDYSQDDNGFFGSAGSAPRMRLEEAATYFEGFTDQLSPRAASDYTIPDPANINTNTVTVNTALGQDEIVVFAGSDLNLPTIGEGGSLHFTTSVRGQADAPASDTEPVVGFISFDHNANWNFGTTAVAGQDDFLSTAIHELAHVMGFGITPAWDNLISGGYFTGEKSKEINGGNVLLDPSEGHWLDGTESTAMGVLGTTETALDPILTQGDRKLLTDLDYAALQDIGWEVPSSVYSNSSSVPFEFSPSSPPQ